MSSDLPPLVSIIIPCFNAKDYILSAVENLINQTYDNIEIIIIDDASDDGTVELLKSFLKPSNVNIVYQKVNKGVAASRNAGILLAQGEYIMFLDADDKYDCSIIEKGISAIHGTECQVFCCAFEKTGMVNKNYAASDYNDSIIAGKNYLDLIFNKKLYQHICAMIIDVRLIKKYALQFDEGIAYSEDLLFIVRVIINSKYIYYCNKPLFKYNIQSNSAMRREFKDERKHTLFVLTTIYDLINKYRHVCGNNVVEVFSIYAAITRLYLFKLAFKSGAKKNLLLEIITYPLPKIKLSSILKYNKKFLPYSVLSFLVEVVNGCKK